METITRQADRDSHESTKGPQVDESASLKDMFEELSLSEMWWMEQYDFLEGRGYRLRPRYRPGWKPSWHTSGLQPHKCEDWINILVRSISHARCGYV
jgi:hypothetical protein